MVIKYTLYTDAEECALISESDHNETTMHDSTYAPHLIAYTKAHRVV